MIIKIMYEAVLSGLKSSLEVALNNKMLDSIDKHRKLT